MAKNSEAILRIRAKNLASKDLRDVTKDIDSLAESQKKNTSAADLAARSVRELTEEQRALQTVANELKRRGGIASALIGQRGEVAKAAGEVRRVRAELDQLTKTKASGGFLGDIDKGIRNVEKQLRDAGRELDRQNTKYNRIAESAAKIGINSENAADTLVEINSQAGRTDELIKSAADAAERHAAAQVDVTQALTTQERVQREITAEAQRRIAVEKQAAAQARESARALAAEQDRIARKRADSIAFFSSPNFRPLPEPGVLAPAGDKAAAEAARSAAFRERLINVLRRQKDAGERLIAADGRLAAATRQVTSDLDRNSRSLDRNNQATGLLADTGRKSLSVYQRLRGQLLSIAAAYVGVFQAVNLVRSAVQIDQQRQGIQIQLQIANNDDPKAAARDIKFLREEADRLGLVFEDVAKSYANFKISADAAGASQNTIRRSFSQSLEVVTALRLSADDADGVFRAFIQILGKSRVQAEELRGQLGDRLPGAVAEFAKSLVATGKIAEENQLDDYLKKGKAGLQDFFAFLERYNAKVASSIPASSNTLLAQFNRLKNAYRDFLATFAEAGATTELRKVVDELLVAFKGEEGQNFARELAKAFTVVAKVVLFAVQNFDKLVLILKLFLGLQAAKAVYGIGSAFAVAAFRVGGAIKSIVAWTAAMNAARIAGTGLTVGMRALLALLGPVGVALGIAATAFYGIARAEAAANKELDDYIGKLRTLREAQGDNLRGQIKARNAEAQRVRQELSDTQALLARQKALYGGAVNQGVERVADVFRDPKNVRSIENLTARVALLKSMHEGLTTAVVNGSRRYIQSVNEEAAAAKAAAEDKDNFAPPKPEDTKDGSDAALKAADLLAEKRRDLADRAARELLEIEQLLSQARLDLEVTTQEQLDRNTAERLTIIDKEIEQRRIQLEGLARDAQRAGSTSGVASAEAAIEQLATLKKTQVERVKEQAILDSIALKEKTINDLIGQRDAEIDAINTKVELGLLTEVEGRQAAIDKQKEYANLITGNIDALIAQLNALPPDLFARLGAGKLVADLEAAKIKATEFTTTLQLVAKNLGGQLATGVTSFFSTFIKGAAGGIEGVNGITEAFKNAGRGFLEFLADFLVGIGEAILQAILLQAVLNAIKGTTGGYTEAALGALTGHTGGVVRGSSIGTGNPTRQVSAAIFAGAQRFHDGGLPGLKKDEVPAILKKREEVLTEDDPRNVLNGGLSPAGAAPMDVSIYNTIDSESVIEAGLGGRRGRKAIFNVIQADKAAFKRLLQN